MVMEGESLANELNTFDGIYQAEYNRLFRAKLGLQSEEWDQSLLSSLFECLTATSADYSKTFLALQELRVFGSAEEVSQSFESVLSRLVTISPSPSIMVDIYERKLRIMEVELPINRINVCLSFLHIEV